MVMEKLNQPYYAFVELYIGGYNFTPIPPQYLLSFRHKRNIIDQANQFSFQVYDDTAIQLETIIAQGAKDVLFRYGYTDGAASELFSGTIWDYTIEFQHGGTVLSVEGTSQILKWHAKRATRTFTNMTPDQIVRKIAEEEGWQIGIIEPCLPIRGFFDDLTGKELITKTFRQLNIPSTKFIKEELLPYAISARTGEGGFLFYFTDTPKGPAVNFTPPRYRQQPTNNFLLDYNQTGRGVIKSFSPEVKGSLLMQAGGTTVATGVDPHSNNFVGVKYTDSSNPNKPVTGSKSMIAYEKGETPINISSATIEEMSARAAYYWYKSANLTYPARLEMVGDPTLQPNTVINVTIVGNAGIPHHTSGLYLITEIIDEIQGGEYTTELGLIKNAVPVGSSQKTGSNVNKTAPKATSSSSSSSKEQYYVVKKGDTLWDIARKYYGKGSLYTEILKKNPQIKNPNKIYPGMKIKI